MKKFLLFLVSLTIALSFGLCSCGGGDSTSTPPFSSDIGSSDTGSSDGESGVNSDTGSSDASSSSSSSSSENHGTWTDDYPVTPVPGK